MEGVDGNISLTSKTKLNNDDCLNRACITILYIQKSKKQSLLKIVGRDMTFLIIEHFKATKNDNLAWSVVGFGHDIWIKIFSRCQAFQLRVLRRVCKTFYEWTNNTYVANLFREKIHEEWRGCVGEYKPTLPFYIECRRAWENRKLKEFKNKEPIYVSI